MAHAAGFGTEIRGHVRDGQDSRVASVTLTQIGLDGRQLGRLSVQQDLDAGPAAAGWQDQRWTLARIRDLIAARFKVQYTIAGKSHRR